MNCLNICVRYPELITAIIQHPNFNKEILTNNETPTLFSLVDYHDIIKIILEMILT